MLREVSATRAPDCIARGFDAPKNGKRVRVKILYVEDNEDNIYVLKNRLTRAGFSVLMATEGEQGVAAESAEHAGLDHHGPEPAVLDGWTATRQLKAAPETKHIPIIALTAHAMSGDREKALDSGMR